MKKEKKTKILNLDIPTNKRLIFISDVHGDIKLFKEALNKVQFTDEDYLFVIGDSFEKGDFLDNHLMLKYMLELDKKNNVYFLSGNCDEIFRFILPPLDKKRFLFYALEKQKSIINDLAYELNYELNDNMNIEQFVDTVLKTYPEYFEFIDNMNDVIFLNGKIVLVHGGILDIENIPENAIDILKFDRFLEISEKQKKIMIVGHYPTRNYCNDKAIVNPIFDFRKNIISIDGGNNVVKGGQINAVILDSLESMKFSYQSFDHYPKLVIKEDILSNKPNNSFNIKFGHNEIEIISKDLDFYLIRPLGCNDLLWVNEEFIFKNGNRYFCYEGSNNFLSLHKGDTISIIKQAMPFSLVKSNGEIGLIETKYIYD